MKNIILFISLILTLPQAFGEAIQLEGKKLGKFPIRVLGSAKYQNAMIGSSDGDLIKSRHMNGVGADVLGGLVLGNFIIGGGGEYMYYAQASDLGEDDDSDMTGSSTNLFGAAGFAVHRFLLLGKYIFQSNYTVNKKEDNGDKLKFGGPEGSFAVTLIYRISKMSFLSAEYNNTTYGDIQGTDTAALKDKKIEFSSVGFAYGVMF